MMMPTPVDLNKLAHNPQFSLAIASIPAEDPRDAKVRRCKELVTFFVAIILIMAAFVCCCYILLAPHFSEADKKWATALAGSIVSAFLGYLIGKHLQ